MKKLLKLLTVIMISCINLIAANNESSQSSATLKTNTSTEILEAINKESSIFKSIEEGKEKTSIEVVGSNSYELEHYQYGKASFYGERWNGRKTANGEIFNTWILTAAHKKLPFGTMVKVTNEENGKSVVVRINDRGPYIKGRVIDLTKAAFALISDIDKGVVKVKLDILKDSNS